MTLTQTTRYAEYLMPDGSPLFGIRTGTTRWRRFTRPSLGEQWLTL
jgi:hypothetical protein